MSTPAVTNKFLLKSAQKQLGFRPTAQVSLNYVDTISPHQRCLSEQLVLMNSFLHSIPLFPTCTIDANRIRRSLRNILKS